MWRWRSCAASTRTCARWSTPCSTPRTPQRRCLRRRASPAPARGLVGDLVGWLRSADSLAGSCQHPGAARRPAPTGRDRRRPGRPVADRRRCEPGDQPGLRRPARPDRGRRAGAPAGRRRRGAGSPPRSPSARPGSPSVALDVFVGLPTSRRPAARPSTSRWAFGPLRVYFRPATGADISLVPFAAPAASRRRRPAVPARRAGRGRNGRRRGEHGGRRPQPGGRRHFRGSSRTTASSTGRPTRRTRSSLAAPTLASHLVGSPRPTPTCSPPTR